MIALSISQQVKLCGFLIAVHLVLFVISPA